MKLKDIHIQILMKVLFSAVILQLLYAALCIGAADGRICGEYLPLYKVPEILECCAASTALTVAGGFILSFSDKLIERTGQ